MSGESKVLRLLQRFGMQEEERTVEWTEFRVVWSTDGCSDTEDDRELR